MRTALLCSLASLCVGPSLHAAHLAMGFKVGEVTQTSAIVWARVTQAAERNWEGVRPPQKREEQTREYVPSPIKVEDREGAVPGKAGQVRLTYFRNDVKGAPKTTSEWMTVEAAKDYTHQFHLKSLEAGANYSLKVEVRDDATDQNVTSLDGEFHTPPSKDQWRNVKFTVVTGQAYWDLDDKNGFHIYPAMGALNPDFLVPTGDTVYLDSESPRAAQRNSPAIIGSGCIRCRGTSPSIRKSPATGRRTTTMPGATIAGRHSKRRG